MLPFTALDCCFNCISANPSGNMTNRCTDVDKAPIFVPGDVDPSTESGDDAIRPIGEGVGRAATKAPEHVGPLVTR